MSKSGRVDLEWDRYFFDNVMSTVGVETISEQAAQRVAATAKANAPIHSDPDHTHTYKDSIGVRRIKTPYRDVFIVEATAPHSLKVEARTGNLLRSLKQARG